MSAKWRDNEIWEILLVRADAKIVRQIQGTARDQIKNCPCDHGVQGAGEQ